jgi:xylulokinase
VIYKVINNKNKEQYLSLLGIDLGTSGIKCVVYSLKGAPLKKVYQEYTLFTPEIGTVELNPEIVWESLKKNLIQLNSSEEIKNDPITALSISVSGDEALPIDKNGKVLYNTIMSMDKRGTQENRYINDLIGPEEIYRITGMPPDSLYALNRLLWFKNNIPHVYEKTYKYLCWEDFIFYKLGAAPSTDYSVACRTLAFNILDNKWAENIVKKVGIDISKFPEAYPSGTEIGRVYLKLCS